MEKIKIKDKKTGAVISVKKELASDYIGTGKFEIHKEKTTKSLFDKPKQVEKND